MKIISRIELTAADVETAVTDWLQQQGYSVGALQWEGAVPGCAADGVQAPVAPRKRRPGQHPRLKNDEVRQVVLEALKRAARGIRLCDLHPEAETVLGRPIASSTLRLVLKQLQDEGQIGHVGTKYSLPAA